MPVAEIWAQRFLGMGQKPWVAESPVKGLANKAAVYLFSLLALSLVPRLKPVFLGLYWN